MVYTLSLTSERSLLMSARGSRDLNPNRLTLRLHQRQSLQLTGQQHRLQVPIAGAPGDDGVHAAVGVDAVGEHRRHDLSDESAERRACRSHTDRRRRLKRFLLSVAVETRVNKVDFLSPMRNTGMKAPQGTGMVVATADIQN
ncbi:hypothetical protein EYF80_051774 [Liparis tanakae]|uniref:Uncharacterized protein n=1 Tax=Liparis tanakae TaxID=230148 RepID=A0A4Z2FA35_9TELE|nr:hypothetical protein EYF80_051774 [Liparis tanakae]